MNRKGIILAGGSGSRLYPITKSLSKQLIPIYDKPMIYYPLCTFMEAGIREILIITNPNDLSAFKYLLGDGNGLGISIEYSVQENPDGLAQAFVIGEKFLKDSSAALVLGDNLFHGNEELIRHVAFMNSEGADIFAYPVKDPDRYGVVEFAENGKVISIEEKPRYPKSRYVITGLYFYDETVVERSKLIVPSSRGELEITDLNNQYLNDDLLNVHLMPKGTAWLDTGTCDSLHEASSYIKTIENRQGYKVSLPEEVAWRNGWINNEELEKLVAPLMNSGYGQYLLELLHKDSKYIKK